MGLRDVLNGMMNGPGGQRQPSTGRNTKGVPRIIWALLGLLAYKAFKGDDGQAVLFDAAGGRYGVVFAVTSDTQD